MSVVPGKVKWFSAKKGFGFVIQDSDGEEIFCHQSDIHAEGFRSLAEDEAVEFVVITEESGKKKATKITGPAGAFVKGQQKRTRRRREPKTEGGEQPAEGEASAEGEKKSKPRSRNRRRGPRKNKEGGDVAPAANGDSA